MADPISIGLSGAALVVAGVSALTARRALRMSEAEHEQRAAERLARPRLGLEVEPTNVETDSVGVIHTEATTHNVILRITVTNSGDKMAGRTHVAAWGPVGLESRFEWVDARGVELVPRAQATLDRSTTLIDDDGQKMPTKRADGTLDSVPLIGEVLHLRVPCPVRMNARSSVPIRVIAMTDGSEPADVLRMIRFVHPD